MEVLKIRLGEYLRLFEVLVGVDNRFNDIVLLKKDNDDVFFLIRRDILYINWFCKVVY